MSTAKRTLQRKGATASGRLCRAVADLQTLMARTAKIIDQTRNRLAGDTPAGATRLVSLHDPDARPIVKGRLGKAVGETEEWPSDGAARTPCRSAALQRQPRVLVGQTSEN